MSRLVAEKDAREHPTLERALQTYARNLPSLLARHSGKFVLIGDDVVVGVFDTFAAAVEEGYRRFGLGPFLAGEIVSDDPVQSSPLETCRT